MTVVGNLLLALAGTPALPGAKCRFRAHLFDAAEPGEPADVTAQRHQQAASLCQRCPSLDACAAWFDSLPPAKKPGGVVAGQDRTPKSPGRAAGQSQRKGTP